MKFYNLQSKANNINITLLLKYYRLVEFIKTKFRFKYSGLMEITFCCSSRDKSLKAKTEYRNQSVSVNCDMDFKAGAPIINAAAVLGYNGMYNYNLYT